MQRILQIKLKQQLGSGAFSTVYLGQTSTQQNLAIKIINPNTQSKDDFLNEANIMRALKDAKTPNIVLIQGHIINQMGYVIAMEYLPHSLTNSLNQLTIAQQVSVTADIARALYHMHNVVKPMILHRDVKPDNVLLTAGFAAKLSDFGLSVQIGVYSQDLHIKGTPTYLAPELLNMKSINSMASDVYSLGLTAWQIVYKKQQVFADIQNCADLIQQVGREGRKECIVPQSDSRLNKINLLIVNSCSSTISQRPTAKTWLVELTNDPQEQKKLVEKQEEQKPTARKRLREYKPTIAQKRQRCETTINTNTPAFLHNHHLMYYKNTSLFFPSGRVVLNPDPKQIPKPNCKVFL